MDEVKQEEMHIVETDSLGGKREYDVPVSNEPCFPSVQFANDDVDTEGTKKIYETMEQVRSENTDVQQLDKVLESENPEEIPVVVPESVADVEQSEMDPEFIKDNLALFEINKRIQAGEKFSVYNALPENYKDMVKQGALSAGVDITDRHMLNSAAKELVKHVAETIEFKQTESELNSIFSDSKLIEDLINLDTETVQQNFEEAAEKFKDNPEVAEKFRLIAKTYTDSLNFKMYEDFLEKNPNELNKLKNGGKYIKRAQRYFDELNSAIKNSGYLFSDVTKLVKLVEDNLHYDFNSISRIFIIIALISRTYHENKKYSGLYRYHSLSIIKKLSLLKVSETTPENIKQLKQNFIDTINNIDSKIDKILNV